MTISGLVEIPLFKTSSLVLSFRHTYYNLYSSDDVNSVVYRNNDNDTTNDIQVNIVPDYMFRDINVKYSAKIHDNDLFYISLYGGNDQFNYNFQQPIKNHVLAKTTEETNSQLGGSAFYGKTWKNGNISNFTASYSELKTVFTNNFKILIPKINYEYQRIDDHSTNSIAEFTAENANFFSINQTHRLEFGTGFKYNTVQLVEDTFSLQTVNIKQFGQRMNVYGQDNMALGKLVNLKIGARFNYVFNLQLFNVEPRASISVDLGKYWKVNAAWGMYSQFITESSVVDENGNYRYIWTVCNGNEIPVLHANHYVLGVALHQNNFVFSLEGYYKYTTGITRYIYSRKFNIQEIFSGNSRTYGMDVMLKKDFGRHTAWISYTLAKTEEFFEYFADQQYHRSPQDQRHEVKLALLLNFDPFFFSSDYVYGSGFPVTNSQQIENNENMTYSRWDASFIYKFLDRKVKAEVGLSVLNILNTQNVKYATFERIPDNQLNTINIYSEAIPFTPTLYLKIAM